MKAKTVLITGANSGVGLATAKALAKKSVNLILLCRNEQKAQQAKNEVQLSGPTARVEVVLADLANLDSVRQAAEQIKRTYPQLDVLINNAGYTPSHLEFTADGIEKSFYASHVGHFVLTWHLLDLLKKTAAETGDVRIINLSSAIHSMGQKSRFFKRIDTLSPWSAYADDKLANILFTKAAARQLAGTGITTYAVHPGVVQTNFGSDSPGFLGQVFKLGGIFMRSPEKGAQTSIFLASAPLKSIGSRNNGGYFADSKPKAIRNRDATDQNADWLWETSLSFV